MALQLIEIPETIKRIPNSDQAASLIDDANDQIESFMLKDQEVIENFVNCDFHLVDQALTWIDQQHLRTGNRFCELGSGFGVVTMLAALRGMQAVGIEIEAVLVDQSIQLAAALELPAKFCCGSFIPRHLESISEAACEIQHVDVQVGDVYEEAGWAMDEFDLFFAFPWPGENHFFESVFAAGAAEGAMLLTYGGREGMSLVRKI